MEDGSHPKFKGKNRDFQKSLRDTSTSNSDFQRSLFSYIALKTSPTSGWRACLPSHALSNAYYRIKKLWSCDTRIAIDPLSMRHSRVQRKNHAPYLYQPTIYRNLNSLAEVQSSCFPWKIAAMAVSKEQSCSESCSFCSK